MRKLILVKHAPPEVVPDLPPEQWTLSDKGRGLCAPLADALAPHAPSVIVSSEEPKAAETALLVADRLGVAWHTAPGLHEHNRSNVPHMRSGEFISMMELLFRRPGELVLGRETADAALERFAAAVATVLDSNQQSNVVVVSHGTVIALWLGAHCKRNAYDLWRRMKLPSLAIVRTPGNELEQLIEKV